MQTVVVVIVEENGCRLGVSLNEEEALTLVAVASEYPMCWDDVVAYWPRYRTPPVPEFADSLALERVDFAANKLSVKLAARRNRTRSFRRGQGTSSMILCQAIPMGT